MFESQDLDKKIERNENKRHLIELQIEALNKESDDFLKSLQVTPEQLTRFIENKDNFTLENWDEIQQQRKSLNDKLERDLKNIPDPRKLKKVYAERHIDPTWTFVK